MKKTVIFFITFLIYSLPVNSQKTQLLHFFVETETYRYGGGIGFRAIEEWVKENSSVLTSEGKTRIDADGTRSRWTDVNAGLEVKEIPESVNL